MARSIVITGQLGIDVKNIGSLMPSVVVSANRSHFFDIKMATASYLQGMECFRKMLRVSLPVILRHSYGRSSMWMNTQLVFPKDSVVFTQTSILRFTISPK